MQANGTMNGFMTAPQRQIGGNLVRALSPSFNDHWSQPRLFLNSLTQQEQQILVNSIRFETSHVKSTTVRQNILTQLNRVSNDLATRVSTALNLPAPAPDPTFYHDNVTRGVNIFGVKLPTAATLTVGILATTAVPDSVQQAGALQQRLARDGVVASVVGEALVSGINQTYSQSDASDFDGLIVAQGAEALFTGSSSSSSASPQLQSSTLFPLGRPAQILLDGYRWGKLVGAMGSAGAALAGVGIPTTSGVLVNSTDVEAMAVDLEAGLRQFRFLDRFPIDQGAAPGADAATVAQSEAEQAQVVAKSSVVRSAPFGGTIMLAALVGVVILMGTIV